MADLRNVDYSSLDYEAIRQEMIDMIPSKLPEWTDHSKNDPGIAILELLAEQLDKINYYADRVANETFLSSATQRKSVIDRCKLIGYELSWQTAAKHYQVFEFVPQSEPIVLLRGERVSTVGSEIEDAEVFELAEDLIIPAGATGLEQDGNGKYLYTVEVVHGQHIYEEPLGEVTSKRPFLSFNLMYTPPLKDTISVVVKEGSSTPVEWQLVDDFISSDQNSLVCKAEMDELDRVSITFGSGSSGKIPEPPAQVTVSYRIGGGIRGNVGANTIVEYAESKPGFVRTFNPYGAHILGEDKESVEEAKINGPASLSRMERYVTLRDYEKGVLEDVPGIAKVKARNTSGTVQVYVMPDNGGVPSDELLQEVRDVVNEKKVLFTNVTVHPPGYVTVNINANLIIQDNYDPALVKYEAENLLREVFDPKNASFGESVNIGKLHYELYKVAGVKNVIISQPTTDVAVGATAVPVLGTLTIRVNNV